MVEIAAATGYVFRQPSDFLRTEYFLLFQSVKWNIEPLKRFFLYLEQAIVSSNQYYHSKAFNLYLYKLHYSHVHTHESPYNTFHFRAAQLYCQE